MRIFCCRPRVPPPLHDTRRTTEHNGVHVPWHPGSWLARDGGPAHQHGSGGEGGLGQSHLLGPAVRGGLDGRDSLGHGRSEVIDTGGRRAEQFLLF